MIRSCLLLALFGRSWSGSQCPFLRDRTDLTAQNLYGQAKDAAREATDAAVSYSKDAYENSGDTFRDGSQAIAKKVQENPLGSMLLAGGIGFALALLMTRPPRRPRLRQRYFG